MNILKILFGKKVETESQPNMSNNESNAQEPCNDDNSKDGAKKTVVDGNKSETTRDDIQNVYHLIVVDESGSMSCIRKQTVDGCNETISHIKVLQEKSKGIQKHYLSLFFLLWWQHALYTKSTADRRSRLDNRKRLHSM